ncbi:uncharacterized protein LOC111404645 [Olea europaea var. sylvestris]|uniref:uncharacterized protein LOC111404645 n=1 Tax=Olea europaea var. sylvestris TaxID=158386 RepID=UPI000C1D7BFE|nr:uncharacterized protein LOC111404645 [Olea europaea var. sylvestris]
MATDEKISKIDKFDGTNFGFWKIQMEDYLYQKNLYKPLHEKPEDMTNDEWELLDRKALDTIRLTLSNSVAFNIKNEKTTTSLMAALSSMYKQPSTANKVHLIKKLFTMKMTEGERFGEHLNEFNEMTDQLNMAEITFSDEVRALLILGQLPKSWNGTVTAIRSSAGKSILKFEDVMSMILIEEIQDRQKQNRMWVIDSGASFHATSNRELFTSYEPRNLGKVYLGDDQPCDVVGKGEIQIKLNGSVWKLKDVRHIPNLRKNLISVGQLSNEGYVITFNSDIWKVSRGAMTIARGKKNCTLYTTMSACRIIAVTASNEDPNLWHQRLGHMSQKGLKYMHDKGKLPRVQSIDADLCESCIFGK